MRAGRYRVLRMDQSDGIGDPGAVLWDLCLCLLLAWVIVYVCLVKGVKSTGKVLTNLYRFPENHVFLRKQTTSTIGHYFKVN